MSEDVIDIVLFFGYFDVYLCVVNLVVVVVVFVGDDGFEIVIFKFFLGNEFDVLVFFNIFG